MKIDPLLPDGWPRPRGYSNALLVEGASRTLYLAGQIGWDTAGAFPDGFAAQFRQTLDNTLAVLAEAGAGPEHIVRMTWYVTDKQDYLANLKGIGEAYRAVMGRHFPAMTMVQVVALIEDEAKVEIEATAVLP